MPLLRTRRSPTRCGFIYFSNFQVREAAETAAGKKFAEYKVVKVATQVCDSFGSFFSFFQVVAGTNFFFKVSVGGNEFVHLRVFRSLPPALAVSLAAHQTGHSHESPLEHFQ